MPRNLPTVGSMYPWTTIPGPNLVPCCYYICSRLIFPELNKLDLILASKADRPFAIWASHCILDVVLKPSALSENERSSKDSSSFNVFWQLQYVYNHIVHIGVKVLKIDIVQRLEVWRTLWMIASSNRVERNLQNHYSLGVDLQLFLQQLVMMSDSAGNHLGRIDLTLNNYICTLIQSMRSEFLEFEINEDCIDIAIPYSKGISILLNPCKGNQQ